MLKEIGKNITTQDNHSTHQPLFVIFQKERQYGMNLDFDLEVAWIHVDGDEASEEQFEELEKEYKINYDEPLDWTRTGYIDIDIFVTAFFTEEGAKNYIEENKHRLKKPFISVDSLYRNEEMGFIREALKRYNKITSYLGQDFMDISEYLAQEHNLLNEDNKRAQYHKNDFEIFKHGIRCGLRYFEHAIDIDKYEAIMEMEKAIKERDSTRDFYKRRTERLNEWFRSDELKDTKLAYEWFAINANGHLMTDK